MIGFRKPGKDGICGFQAGKRAVQEAIKEAVLILSN
jgi:hypothetical protein